MYATWIGLWAAGLLTRTQRLQLLTYGVVDDEAVAALWGDVRRRPKKWAAFDTADALTSHAAAHYERLQHALKATEHPARIVDAAALNVQGRSPYLCIIGSAPPKEGALGIVGTRAVPQHEEKRLTQWLFPLVGQCNAVISGGAHGVDTIAHRVAIESKVPTWVVFASGLSHASPKANLRLFEQCLAQGGGWISEKPPWYTPYPADFLERNSVIAALSNAVLVARAPHRSGALSTARAARSLGKPVLAFPGNPDNENALGCHELLQRGALWASPKTHLVRHLGTDDQLSLIKNSEASTQDFTNEWTRVHWTEEEGVMLRKFMRWHQAGQVGWINNNATEHQEMILDLELAGWIIQDSAGQAMWSDKGQLAEKLLQSAWKDDA